MFRFTYMKSSAAIRAKAEAKVQELEAKVEERRGRLVKLREEYGITDSVLVDLLKQARAVQKRGESKMSYTISSNMSVGSGSGGGNGGGLTERDVTIGAGVVNNLLTEGDLIESEMNTIKRLQFVIRNLEDLPDESITTLTAGVERPMRGHSLTYEELEFLNF